MVNAGSREGRNKRNNETGPVVPGQHINSDLVAAVQTLSISCDLHSFRPSLSPGEPCLDTTRQGSPIKGPFELIAKKIESTEKSSKSSIFINNYQKERQFTSSNRRKHVPTLFRWADSVHVKIYNLWKCLKFYWESVNGPGIHNILSSRALLSRRFGNTHSSPIQSDRSNIPLVFRCKTQYPIELN